MFTLTLYNTLRLLERMVRHKLQGEDLKSIHLTLGDQLQSQTDRFMNFYKEQNNNHFAQCPWISYHSSYSAKFLTNYQAMGKYMSKHSYCCPIYRNMDWFCIEGATWSAYPKHGTILHYHVEHQTGPQLQYQISIYSKRSRPWLLHG